MESAGETTLKVMKNANWYNDWVFSSIEQYCRGEILEIGAGIGNFTDLLLKKGSVTAIDIDKKYLQMYKKTHTKNLSSGFGDVENNKYFFGDKKFDTIICFNVLEHIENHLTALKNTNRLLKKNGKLILIVPAHMALFSEFDKTIGHFRRYTLNSVNLLLKNAKYTNIKSRYINWISMFGWYLFLTLSKSKTMSLKNVKVFNFLGKFLLWPEKFIKLPFGLSVLAIAEK